ncbi:MAG: hypothetical protein KJP22_05135 [Acidimicrobiia bacterium]|nr:hypothetical protein [Acidimicrobiia bacterium]MBT8192766.1 hypothetical protein [Acidimicrobiia bacterium]NNL14471.1 hypothetical protein [Acidimicrobiia bacterium]
MRTTARTDKKSRSGNWKPLKILALGLVIAAVIKELRLPQEERTWHGALGGFVPYDFRMPTMDKVKHTFWDPEGSIIVDRVFGVGWTINLGAVVAKVRSLAG